MTGYELIMKVQQKMQDPKFAKKFNSAIAELNNIQGLQQEVMRIAQIQDEKKKEKAIDKLPDRAKKTVKELLKMIND
ncbi:hypothetical protein [Clostridium uliginosum]|uniref:Uncharacterized protein n=1 Tax=Clostridium uliginosum TaxID=119641 RepID=A0A1I1HC72_9CLOT|nr:hypothetical protein [Clostridium uliginosum]SFC21607.1 hypothetical protein SAMN05421842_101259 [Clostridium uliginosum]